MTAPMIPSPKNQGVSNLASRKFNSIITPPIKAYVAQKGEAEQYEYKSKGTNRSESLLVTVLSQVSPWLVKSLIPSFKMLVSISSSSTCQKCI